MHEPPVFAFEEAIVFWIALAWVFFPEFRLMFVAAQGPKSEQDKGTLRLIDHASDLALVLAFMLSFLPWLSIPYARAALYAGTALLIGGGLLRRYCFRTLGDYFTADVIVRREQPVIERGPYRWIRHPGYSAAFLIYSGIGLALGSGLSLIVLWLVAVFVYRRRIKVEEQALLATIGEPYRQYMTRTKRLIPFVF